MKIRVFSFWTDEYKASVQMQLSLYSYKYQK